MINNPEMKHGASSLGASPAELLRKYDVAAPRYTSYPPAPYWGEADGRQAAGWLSEKSAAPSPTLSLYVHVPFCNKRCLYCGCFVIITPDGEQARPYMEAVGKEMEIVRGHMAEPRPVRQFHLGGGTPNFLLPADMKRLVERARENFPFAPNPEMSIELDPRSLTGEYLSCLRELGFNRVSLGVQDFDDKVMETVNRLQPFEMVAKTVETARELGFDSVNIDLIYGLPHQSEESFLVTIERVGQLKPDRLAVYNYAHLPHINPYQRRLDASTLPGPDQKTAIFLLAREKLMGWGYVPIGLDHFALPDDDLSVAYREGSMRRNFMGYTTQAGTDLLGFGISSISEFNSSFWQNEKKLNRYYKGIESGALPVIRGMQLGDEDLLRKAVIADLFCKGRLDYGELGRRFELSFAEHMQRELADLAPLADDGLVELNPDSLRITERGQLFLRHIAMAFDTYMREKESTIQFSRAL